MNTLPDLPEIAPKPYDILLDERTVHAGQTLMTSFGLWLDSHGYGEYADAYSDPDVVRQRLQGVSTRDFVIGDDFCDDLSEQSPAQVITALPIDYFRTVTGADFTDADPAQQEDYTRHEDRLLRSLGQLTILSMEATADPHITAPELRQQVVEALNTFATHDDGDKQVVNGQHFSRFSAATFAHRPPNYWLGRLMASRDMAQYSLVDDALPEQDLMQPSKTTRADLFVYDTLSPLDDSTLRDEFLASISGVHGYIATAQLLFGGDMKKTYERTSVLAKKAGATMPEGWQQFHGSTADFARIQQVLETAQPGLAGYLAIADEQFGGNMKKAYMNISAVATMTGVAMPEGWQLFHGSSDELRAQAHWCAEHSTHTLQSYRAAFYTNEKQSASGDKQTKSRRSSAAAKQYSTEYAQAA